MSYNLALIALGANLSCSSSSPAETLRKSVALISRSEGLELRAVSRFYSTPAFPPGSGPDYVNACISLRTAMPPAGLLALLHRIEAGLGRRRDTGRWAARAIDLDLLAMGPAVLPDPDIQDRWRALSPERQRQEAPDRLILPHPRLQDRAFVLVPLADIAPGWQHPRTGQSVAQMLAALPPASRAEARVLLDNP